MQKIFQGIGAVVFLGVFMSDNPLITAVVMLLAVGLFKLGDFFEPKSQK